MNIFQGIFKARDKPKNLGGGTSFLWGGSSSGKVVNEKTAMQMTAVYSCVRILSEAIAGLPLFVYKYGDDGSKDKYLDHPLWRVLHDEPNPEMTSFVFRETMMNHLLLTGNAYAQIIRNARGDVVALYPLMPDRMTVDRDSHGRLFYRYRKSSDDPPEVSGNKPNDVILAPSDVLHILGLGFDGLVGYSPIAMAKSNNSNKIAVLEEGLKYTPIAISPEQAQFLETRKFQINEIARIFRVPPHMLADLEKSSFSNIEQQSLEFVKYTLDPWVIRWEQAMNKSLLLESEKKDVFTKFNVDGLLRGDYASRMTGYATARQNGWMSANDIRQLENLDRIPSELGGDLYLINGAMTKLQDAGAFANTTTTETEETSDGQNKSGTKPRQSSRQGA